MSQYSKMSEKSGSPTCDLCVWWAAMDYPREGMGRCRMISEGRSPIAFSQGDFVTEKSFSCPEFERSNR